MVPCIFACLCSWNLRSSRGLDSACGVRFAFSEDIRPHLIHDAWWQLDILWLLRRVLEVNRLEDLSQNLLVVLDDVIDLIHVLAVTLALDVVDVRLEGDE